MSQAFSPRLTPPTRPPVSTTTTGLFSSTAPYPGVAEGPNRTYWVSACVLCREAAHVVALWRGPRLLPEGRQVRRQLWKNRLDDLESLTLEIEGNEPQTEDIQYVPFKLVMDRGAAKKRIVPNQTTVLDVQMRRVPSADVFRIFRY